MTVGQRIKQLRLFKLGWSRDTLTIALGKRSSKCVTDWEHDNTHPNFKTYHKLLEIFDITDEEFMKGVDLE
jgi:ribosome-binding protein aMBF1 (putative translation factor)